MSSPKRPGKPAAKPSSEPKSKSPVRAPKALVDGHIPGVILDHRAIVIDADPRSLARAQALTQSIVRRKKRIAEEFYDLGLELVELKRKGYYRKVYGYPTLSAFLDGFGLYSSTQARKLMKIVQSMTRERAIGLGVEKAYASVVLVEATPESDTAEEIFARGRKVSGKKPAKASVRDFVEETKAVRARAKPRKVRSEKERLEAATVDSGVSKLRALLAKVGLERVTIKLGEDEAVIRISRSQLVVLGSGSAKRKPD